MATDVPDAATDALPRRAPAACGTTATCGAAATCGSAAAGAAGERGFTLIEILVAFTIAALALGALAQVFSTAVGATTRAVTEKQALLIAQSSLEGLGVGETLRPLDTSERVDGNYTRRVVVRPRADGLPVLRGGPQPVLYEIELTISWTETLRAQSISLRTLRLSY